MTSFLWTYTDLATVYLGYHHGLFDYDEFRRRHAEMKNEMAERVSHIADGRDSRDAGADLSLVSGCLTNSAPLPHRATRSSSGLKEQDA